MQNNLNKFGSRYFLYPFLLSVVFPGLLYASAYGSVSRSILDGELSLLLLVFSIILYSTARLTVLAGSYPRYPISVTFHIFNYIWVGLIPYYQFLVGEIPWNIILPTHYYIETYIVIWVGIASFELTWSFTRISELPSKKLSYFLSKKRLMIFWAFTVFTATMLGPILTPIAELISSRNEYISNASDIGVDRVTRLMFSSLMRIPILVVMLALLWKMRNSYGSNSFYTKIFIVTLPLFILVNFPTAIPRLWLGTIIVSAITTYLLTFNSLKFQYTPILLTLGILIVYPLAHYLRMSDLESSGSFLSLIIDTYVAGSFDVVAMVAQSLYYVEQTKSAISWGYQLLGPVFFWVPRSIWEAKPIGSGSVIAQSVGFDFFNVSAPLWAEGIVNFSYFGVCLLFSIYGWTVKKIESSYHFSKRNIKSVLVVSYISGLQFIVLRGDLITASLHFLPFIVCIYFLFPKVKS